MAVSVRVEPDGAGTAECVDAGHESGQEEGVQFDYTWFRATASRASVKWRFKEWRWDYVFETTDRDGNVERTVRERVSNPNPLERRDDYDFGNYTIGPDRYGNVSHSSVENLVAVFERVHHNGSGLIVYNRDGTIRCNSSGVCYDNSF